MSSDPYLTPLEPSGKRRETGRNVRRAQPMTVALGRQMAGADREETNSLQRFLRLARLRREVDEARRADEVRQRLELQLSLDAS
jgi:hypothetical protein